MEDLISIIVPVYNVQKYLKKCIDSILNQVYKNFEIILVNDGSTDNSYSICCQYKAIDNRIKVITQSNRGLSAARNTGINIARGKYICFVDSDDYIEKDYLSLLLNNIKKYNSDIAMCEFFLVSEAGKKIGIEEFNEPQEIKVLSGKKTFFYFYEDDYIPNVVSWNKLYLKSLFDNLKFKEGAFFEDEYIAQPLFFKARKVSFVRKPLYNYVQRKDSIVHSPLTLKKIIDTRNMYRGRINFFKGKDEKFYKLSVQQYKDWIIEIGKSKNRNLKKFNFQDEYRNFWGIRNRNSFKVISKDIVGYINLNLLSMICKSMDGR